MADELTQQQLEQFSEILKKAGVTAVDLTDSLDRMKNGIGSANTRMLKELSLLSEKGKITNEIVKMLTGSLTIFDKKMRTLSESSTKLKNDIVELNETIKDATDAEERALLKREQSAKKSIYAIDQMSASLTDGAKKITDSVFRQISYSASSLTQSLLTTHAGLGTASQAMRMGVDLANTAWQGGANTAKSLGDSLKGTGGKLGFFGHALSIAGSAASVFGNALSEVAKSGMNLLQQQTEQVMHGFLNMASAGAVYTGGITEMKEAVTRSGMTMDQFSKSVVSNKDTLLKSGLGITDGSKRLAKAMEAGGVSARNGMFALGYTMEEQAELYAESMARLAGPAGKLHANDAEVAKETEEYAKSLRVVSELTGKNAKEQQAFADSKKSTLNMQIALSKMSTEQRKSVDVALRSDSDNEYAATALQDRIKFGGKVVDSTVAQMESLSPSFKALNEEIYARSLDGTLDDTKIAELKKKYAEGINRDIQKQEHLSKVEGRGGADPTIKGLATLMSSNSKVMSADVDKLTTNLTDAQKKGKATDEKGGEAGSITNLFAAGQNMQVKLQELGFQHLDKYTKILELTMNGMTEAINKFAKVTSGKMDFSAKSIGEFLSENIESVLTIAFMGISSLASVIIAKKTAGTFEKIARDNLEKIALERTAKTVPEVNVPVPEHSRPAPEKGAKRPKGSRRSRREEKIYSAPTSVPSPSPAPVVSGGAGKTMGMVGEIGELIVKFGADVIELGMTAVSKGLQAFANPLVLQGAGFLGLSIAAIGLGIGAAAWIMGEALPKLAESLGKFKDIDGKNLTDVGAGMASLGLGISALNVGNAFGSLAGLGTKVMDGFLGMFGVKSNIDTVIENMKKFSDPGINAAVVKNNAEAMSAFSNAFSSVSGISSPGIFTSITNSLSDLFAGGDPLTKLVNFSATKFDLPIIENNAKAFKAFDDAISSFKGASTPGIFKTITNNLSDLFAGGDPLTQFAAFGATKFDLPIIENNAKAFKAFDDAISSFKGASTPGIFKTITNNLSDLFAGGDPLTQFSAFGATKFDLPTIENNAKAFTAFASALAAYTGSGVGIGTAIAESILSFFRVDPPIKQLNDFSKISLNTETIKNNADAFVKFSNALSLYVGTSGVDIATALSMSVMSFFRVDPPVKQFADFSNIKIDPKQATINANAFIAFANAMSAYKGLGTSSAIDDLVNKVKGWFAADPFSEMVKFGQQKFDNAAIEKNAKTFLEFANSMAAYSGAGSKFAEMKINIDEDANAVLKLDNRMKSLIDRFKELKEHLSKLSANFNMVINKDGEVKISSGTGGNEIAPAIKEPPKVEAKKPEVPTAETKPQEPPKVEPKKPEPPPATAGANAVAGGAVSKPSAPTEISKESTVGVKGLLERIAQGEGTSDAIAKSKGLKSGYDVSLGYGAYGGGPKKALSEMTFAEVKAYQKEMLKDPKNKLRSSAVGKYQFISGTLAELQKKMGISDDAKFDAETQDKMGEMLLKRRGLDKFKSGKMSQDEFQTGLAAEWASIADPRTKKSRYGQHVGTTDSQIKDSIARLGMTEEVNASKEKVAAAKQVEKNTAEANKINENTAKATIKVSDNVKSNYILIGENGERMSDSTHQMFKSIFGKNKETNANLSKSTVDADKFSKERDEIAQENARLLSKVPKVSTDLSKSTAEAAKLSNDRYDIATETDLLLRKVPKVSSDLTKSTMDADKFSKDQEKAIRDRNDVLCRVPKDLSSLKSNMEETQQRFHETVDLSKLQGKAPLQLRKTNESLINEFLPKTDHITDSLNKTKRTVDTSFKQMFTPATDVLTEFSKKQDVTTAMKNTFNPIQKIKDDFFNNTRSFNGLNVPQPNNTSLADKKPTLFMPKVNENTNTFADGKFKEMMEMKERAEADRAKGHPMEKYFKQLVDVQNRVASNTESNAINSMASVGAQHEANRKLNQFLY
jgi:muramidase (phage lysozyme)